MKVLGIIPFRLESKRFPNKPLAMINDKPIVQHVYESAMKSKALDALVVVTDSLSIKKAVEDVQSVNCPEDIKNLKNNGKS